MGPYADIHSPQKPPQPAVDPSGRVRWSPKAVWALLLAVVSPVVGASS